MGFDRKSPLRGLWRQATFACVAAALFPATSARPAKPVFPLPTSEVLGGFGHARIYWLERFRTIQRVSNVVQTEPEFTRLLQAFRFLALGNGLLKPLDTLGYVDGRRGLAFRYLRGSTFKIDHFSELQRLTRESWSAGAEELYRIADEGAMYHDVHFRYVYDEGKAALLDPELGFSIGSPEIARARLRIRHAPFFRRGQELGVSVPEHYDPQFIPDIEEITLPKSSAFRPSAFEILNRTLEHRLSNGEASAVRQWVERLPAPSRLGARQEMLRTAWYIDRGYWPPMRRIRNKSLFEALNELGL